MCAVFGECHTYCTIKDYFLSLSERVGVVGPYKWFIGIYTSLHFQCRHVMEHDITISSLKPLVSLSFSFKRQYSTKSFDIIFLFLIFLFTAII